MTVSFVASVFTMVPVQEALDIIGDLLPADIASLFRHVLTTTYFQWKAGFYEQTYGLTMGSPLSPMAPKVYMEKFEEIEVISAPSKRWNRRGESLSLKRIWYVVLPIL